MQNFNRPEAHPPACFFHTKLSPLSISGIDVFFQPIILKSGFKIFIKEKNMKKLLAVAAVSVAALLSAQTQAKNVDIISGAQKVQEKIDAAAAKAEEAKAKQAEQEAKQAEKRAEAEAKAAEKKAELQKKIEEQKAAAEQKKAEMQQKAQEKQAERAAKNAEKKKAVNEAGQNLKNSFDNLKKAVSVQ